MSLLLNDLAALESSVASSSGAPLSLAVDAVDEDPAQPRTEFNEVALQGLADTIRERGVKQPVSVRPHPTAPGRWMLNFGARRLRASRMAGLKEIPAFVDNAADSYDQVIENEQREGLKPLELALFIQRRLTAGDNQAEIARRLGKSRQYITMAMALIDAPDWLMSAYREGRCRGLTELYELRKLFGAQPQLVETWTAACNNITRDRVAALRAELASSAASVRDAAPAGMERSVGQGEHAQMGREPASTSSRTMRRDGARSRTSSALQLVARLDGTEVVVDTLNVPESPGRLYVRPIDGGNAEAVDATRLTLVGLFAPRGCQAA
jgi:ParB family transcriptional regulator, chromosome partitioning protein